MLAYQLPLSLSLSHPVALSLSLCIPARTGRRRLPRADAAAAAGLLLLFPSRRGVPAGPAPLAHGARRWRGATTPPGSLLNSAHSFLSPAPSPSPRCGTGATARGRPSRPGATARGESAQARRRGPGAPTRGAPPHSACGLARPTRPSVRGERAPRRSGAAAWVGGPPARGVFGASRPGEGGISPLLLSISLAGARVQRRFVLVGLDGVDPGPPRPDPGS